jgi:CRISPR/Cas system CSM-associated protein Csm3 (group 7 of RAMP superfamily)
MYQIQFKIHSYWRAGTGRGGGALLDELVHRDAYGLPNLPGRTVKGLLRDAVYRAEQWQRIPKDSTLCWFGSNAIEPGEDEIRLETEAGALGVSDAVLDDELKDYLISLLTSSEALTKQKGKKLCQGFYHQIYATAIEHETGSAKDKSLRGTEVTIPLTLTATLYELHSSQLTDNWHQQLEKCLPLIRAVGTSRSRGLGRVTVELKKSG